MKSDRTGLLIVAASLMAIAAIVYLVFESQHEQRLASIRTQGVSIVRALSGVPYEQLAPGGSQQNILQVLRHGARDNEFAYVGIVSAQGIAVNEVVADGLIIPPATMPTEPSAWLGEARRELAGGQGEVIEFHGPLLAGGELRGFVRLGYRSPGFGVGAGELPFFAAVALPVFLLVPLFYFLLRREIRPVRAANEEISRMIDGDQIGQMQVSATGELGDFMRRFNKFVEIAGARIEGL
ncbi:MAG: hypothetical protein KJO31_15450, partial [Gammaproteobacteria bacterium]|nr:hypothetical protein [Gammaproteobacteria bacterium]